MARFTIMEKDAEFPNVAILVGEEIKKLRRGYPNLPFEEQCCGADFRLASKSVTYAIAFHTLLRTGFDKSSRTVIMMPWRAGLAFAGAYNTYGIKRFYHVSSKRDESTLETRVDYEGGCAIASDDIVIVADPMLATGNTTCDSIQRALDKGVHPDHVYVNAVVAAPEGVAHVRRRFPDVGIIVGALDEKLDERGYIVPGLGDFGDKYFYGATREEKLALAAIFETDPETELRLIARLMAA